VKIFAANHEPVVVVPIVLEVVQVEPAIVRVQVQISHVNVAVRVLPTRGGLRKISSLPLPLEYSHS